MVKGRVTWMRILYVAMTLMALVLASGAGRQWD